jgi:hypothetical protein
MPTYTASRISTDNTLFPDKLDIDCQGVTYYKGYVFGYKSTVIAANNIASVSVRAGILFADVIIESIGGNKIVASGCRKSDAMKILELLT